MSGLLGASLGGAALAATALLLWGLAYGAYLWPDLRRWWRTGREPAETRMLRAHAEWVRRTAVLRPPLPRRQAVARPVVMRPTTPARAATAPVAAPPNNVIPFPKPPSRPRR